MTTVAGAGGAASVQQVTGGLDLESFMMMVSAERASNLESQMAGQINEIKQRQDEIKEMNQLLNDVRRLMPQDDSQEWTLLTSIDPDKNPKAAKADAKQLFDRLEKAGVTIMERQSGGDKAAGYCDSQGHGGVYDARKNTFELWTQELKAKLDDLNSTSQMDMIRLQSISNKRNQAFEMLTNQVQKFARTNDTIVGNMR